MASSLQHPGEIARLHEKIRIVELGNHGDTRGFAFDIPREALEFLGQVADMHLASSAPGSVRGNHYHTSKCQAIFFLPGTAWSLHWDDGEGTETGHREFDGTTAVLMLISPGASQAVRNEGETLLWLVMCSSEPYDPSKIVARKVI
jgi:dTDP-4-dehydrorhamnose 3,5-epimerase-like enzyme